MVAGTAPANASGGHETDSTQEEHAEPDTSAQTPVVSGEAFYTSIRAGARGGYSLEDICQEMTKLDRVDEQG